MHVLIVGGSGFVGTHLAHELISGKHRVRIFSRTAPPDLPPGAEHRRGDVTDPASLGGAFDGIDSVVYLVALSPLFRPAGGERQHERVHLGGARHVIEAARSAGVRRLVHMSALGADADGPTAYLRAKGRAERLVRESDLEATILRPSVVFGEGGEFVASIRRLAPPYLTPLPGGGRIRFQPIWVGDLVRLIGRSLEPRHVGKTYELGGPERLSLADIARTVHGVAGRPVRVLPVPLALAGLGLHLAGWIPGLPMGPDQYRSLFQDNVTDRNAVGELGMNVSELRTLRDFLVGARRNART